MCVRGQTSHLIQCLITPEAKFEMFLSVQYSAGFFVARLAHSVYPIPLSTAATPHAFLAQTPFSQDACWLCTGSLEQQCCCHSEKSRIYWRRNRSSMLSTEVDLRELLGKWLCWSWASWDSAAPLSSAFSPGTGRAVGSFLSDNTVPSEEY